MASNRVLLSDVPGLGSVSVCECGTLHLSVGPMTLRLAPEAFLQMLNMCKDALQEINHDPSLLTQQQPSPLMH